MRLALGGSNQRDAADGHNGKRDREGHFSPDGVRQDDRKEHTRNFEHCRQHEVESRREVFAILATRFVLHHKHHFRERLWKNVDQT